MKDHIGSSPDAVIILRPPSPPSVSPPNLAHHQHRKNHKGRVIVHIWSRRFTSCYETEFCPDCPISNIRETLSNFCAADKSYFAAARWLTLQGQNGDTVKAYFSPDSTVQMANFLELIKKRDYHGGKITMKIVRKGQAVSKYTVMLNVQSRYAKLREAGLLFDRVH